MNNQNEKNLTSYDLFMLKKRQAQQANAYAPAENFARDYDKSGDAHAELKRSESFVSNKTDAYSQYLLDLLQGKSVGNGAVLTKEEYYKTYGDNKGASYNEYSFATASDGGRNGMYREDISDSTKIVKNNKPSLFTKMFGNVQFKKGGKFLLALYVIIVVCVASILIVLNTTNIASDNIADAKEPIVTEEQTEKVNAMTLDDTQEEESNWFDRLCDALNK